MIGIEEVKNQLEQHERNIMGHAQATKSAVLLPLVYHNGTWCVLFEVRAKALKRQPGEICFPGGRMEAADQNAKETAIRETSEELRINQDRIHLLGELDILLQSHDSFIYPYVGEIAGGAGMDPNEEVEEVFTVPLQWLIENEPELHYLDMQINPEQNFPFELIPNGKDYNWRNRQVPEYFYRYSDYVIWGLTARILRHFIGLISS